MSVIKVEDIAAVRFSAPDLGRMRQFLLDFGLAEAAEWNDGVLRMRGTDTAPYCHVTERGEPGFRGLALRARSIEDLKKLAASESVPVKAIDAPGGGWMIRLVDPNGFEVDVVAGQAPGEIRAAEDNGLWNFATKRPRHSATKRVTPGPSNVTRLGHAVLLVKDLGETWRWWEQRFGLLISDEVRDPGGNPAALFVRCDRGAVPTDHHTLNFASVPGKPAQFHHAAFEVADLDSLMVGHDYLASREHRHVWGIGRHILGSQVFDYWLDPFGNRVEHWTDGDVFAADAAPARVDLATMMGRQWGPPAPPTFV